METELECLHIAIYFVTQYVSLRYKAVVHSLLHSVHANYNSHGNYILYRVGV